MAARSSIVGMVLCLCSTAHAGGTSFLELRPNTPGPYTLGATVDVDIVFHNREGQGIDFRLLQVDVIRSI